jgi:hypothetical protein
MATHSPLFTDDCDLHGVNQHVVRLHRRGPDIRTTGLDLAGPVARRCSSRRSLARAPVAISRVRFVSRSVPT